MLMTTDFLSHVLAQFASSDCIIHITDPTARILASTHETRIGTSSSTAQYIVRIRRPASIENTSAQHGENATIHYGTPIIADSEMRGTVIVRGAANTAATQGNAIKLFLETFLTYQASQSHGNDEADVTEQIVSQLFTSPVDAERISSLMYKQEMDPHLLRSVICIRLEYHQTRYFNINLNLGYQASIERIKQEALQKIRCNRYLNSQDIVYAFNRNTLIIAKSFIPVGDLSRVYLSLDAICRDIKEDLTTFSAFTFHMAYGNLYYGVTELKKSLHEAMEMIDIGRKIYPAEQLFMLDTILFDNVCHYLDPQVINKLLQPDIKKLRRKDGSMPDKIITCAEAFVDNCMNLSATAQKTGLHRNTISTRLEKLQSMTGLNPAENFRDAFLVKMLATHLRQNQEEQSQRQNTAPPENVTV